MGIFDRPDKNVPWRDGVFLTTAGSSFEADIIESKLDAEDIPCVRNYHGAANFMEVALGANTIQDIDIYVPESTLERAKKALVAVPIGDDFEEAGPDDEDPDK